ncbi:hypothetical protein KC354_g27 [Hortaea werneckii]|nr:hypothetical protein KC354_g27 [Hortaea werneckii]
MWKSNHALSAEHHALSWFNLVHDDKDEYFAIEKYCGFQHKLREVPTFYETMAKGTPRVCVQREGAASLSLFDRPTGEECASVSIIFTNYSKIALRLSPFRINPIAKAHGYRGFYHIG